MDRNDKRHLIKALRKSEATPLQIKMAVILLTINGIESALEFIADKEKEKNKE